ncbi:MAG: ATP-dependent DNA ligase [Synechococcus sp.]
MQAFQVLLDQLDRINGTNGKVAALTDHLQQTPAADAAWALVLFLGKKRRRLITGRRLREVLAEESQLPEWLIIDCYAQVGDSAETISLLWPTVRDQIRPRQCPDQLAGLNQNQPLHWWMECCLPAIGALKGDDQTNAILALWQAVPTEQHYVVNKLLTGGFRVGVSSGLISRAIAKAFALEETLVIQRLMGGFEPTVAAFERLTAKADAAEARSDGTPYPFYLASPLEPTRLEADDPNQWQLEWKWDGIRGQLIHRGEGCYLWSRGEELINDSFPELVAVAEALPDGTVLDGEVICWEQGAATPLGFDVLQRRLGRKQVGSTLKRECPMRFIAYDLLEENGQDLRDRPLMERQQRLADQLSALDHSDAWRLAVSPTWPLQSWATLDQERDRAQAQRAEGLMLKHRESPYLSGRKRGHWWKHKLQPMTLDAVLLYAQAGSGRRANLFTDYTFGLWRQDSEGAPELVTFAKAYSGLNDQEILELDRWIRRNTLQRFGPTRSVKAEQVFELAFEGIHPSKRHKSGLAVRFPRILRWRQDKPAAEADQLRTAQALILERQLGR